MTSSDGRRRSLLPGYGRLEQWLLYETVLGQAYRSYLDRRYELYRRRQSIPRQRPLLEHLVDRDEFVLVVLDACRFDRFSEEYGAYLDGDLKRVWATANNTPNYAANAWPDRYDLNYVAAAPWISDLAWETADEEEPLVHRENRGYRPSEHFAEIVPLWATDWDAARFTVPPGRVTHAALAAADGEGPTRVVAHYLQPHRPYIGETAISPWRERAEEGATTAGATDDGAAAERELTPEDVRERDLGWKEQAERDLSLPRRYLQESVESGDLTGERLRRAYRDNLRLVLDHVERLISGLDVPVVVTSDHGEFLGEGSRYLHRNFTHPLLREVPWLEVDPSMLSRRDGARAGNAATPGGGDAVDEEEMRERLEHLGYLDDR